MQNMQENKQNNNLILIIVIVIMSIVITGLAGYIIYDKLSGDSNNQITKEKDQVNDEKNIAVPVELTLTEQEEIFEIVNELSDNFAKYYPISDLSNISNQDLLVFALKKNKGHELISKTEIDNTIKKYFGNSLSVIHQNVRCKDNHDVDLYLFDGNNYTYNPNHGGHGGNSRNAEAFYISGKINDDIITANYKILYSNNCSDTCILSSYYASYEDSVNSNNALLENHEYPGVELTDELYKTVEDKVPTTTFKFKKEKDGSYSLISVEISK